MDAGLGYSAGAENSQVPPAPSMVLRPGTVILTGTPHGVGFARNPPVFLQSGDTVTVEIDRIGRLTNPVAEEA